MDATDSHQLKRSTPLEIPTPATDRLNSTALYLAEIHSGQCSFCKTRHFKPAPWNVPRPTKNCPPQILRRAGAGTMLTSETTQHQHVLLVPRQSGQARDHADTDAALACSHAHAPSTACDAGCEKHMALGCDSRSPSPPPPPPPSSPCSRPHSPRSLSPRSSLPEVHDRPAVSSLGGSSPLDSV